MENLTEKDKRTKAEKVKSKLVDLKAEWIGDCVVEARGWIYRSCIKVIASYEDGTSVKLENDEWSFKRSFEKRFPNANRLYEITVVYKQISSGIIKEAKFDVTISGSTYSFRSGMWLNGIQKTVMEIDGGRRCINECELLNVIKGYKTDSFWYRLIVEQNGSKREIDIYGRDYTDDLMNISRGDMIRVVQDSRRSYTSVYIIDENDVSGNNIRSKSYYVKERPWCEDFDYDFSFLERPSTSERVAAMLDKKGNFDMYEW